MSAQKGEKEKELGKEDLASKLRDLLGVDVKFEKLSKEDLVKLFEVVSNAWRLAEVGMRSIRDRVSGVAEREALNKPLREVLGRPSILRDLFQRKGGLLGFGIFDLGKTETKGESKT